MILKLLLASHIAGEILGLSECVLYNSSSDRNSNHKYINMLVLKIYFYVKNLYIDYICNLSLMHYMAK